MDLKPGTQVRVVEGPFANSEGKVLEIEDDTIQVEVEIFCRKTPIEVTLNQIEQHSRGFAIEDGNLQKLAKKP